MPLHPGEMLLLNASILAGEGNLSLYVAGELINRSQGILK
jgi:hypothetical protein